MPRLDVHTFFGLDLGRRQDPSALAILERRHDYTGRRDPVTFELELKLRFVLRHVEAFPLAGVYDDRGPRWGQPLPNHSGRGTARYIPRLRREQGWHPKLQPES